MQKGYPDKRTKTFKELTKLYSEDPAALRAAIQKAYTEILAGVEFVEYENVKRNAGKENTDTSKGPGPS